MCIMLEINQNTSKTKTECALYLKATIKIPSFRAFPRRNPSNVFIYSLSPEITKHAKCCCFYAISCVYVRSCVFYKIGYFFCDGFSRLINEGQSSQKNISYQNMHPCI